MRMSLAELEPIAAALRKNNMAAHCVLSKEDVVPLIKTLLHAGDTVAVGGSMTLFETGVIDLLRSGDYHFLDRYQDGLTPEELNAIFAKGLTADVFLCSSNAVTRGGELYNVDGRGNRISPIAFGPTTVVMVVGCNKIVDDLPAAVRRVKTVAAPLNAKRLNCQTPCAFTGVCTAVDSDCHTDGCQSPDRICSHYLINSQQRGKNRIHVVLVGESLGF